ncbi:enoyl-CoA hydratase/carnithine racemase [Sphingobium xenophagum]|uniref:Enoyl-CoA hydratase/carnithine racemase n=1 Tax=Sphingobium xenophagum TaxID=121428 RepID=A0ABU1X5K5_SPHXE|nr:enoyl-CoA hydratase-related protein [Sphingobium xenophagum]MDR7156867.1 enoyl-CoA hydratase/carnithine racemase [Sphingobium xenophagum]
MNVVTVEIAAPHVALVTIRRPEARNAINGFVAQALDRAVKQIESDPDLWVAVLTGEGGVAFCAGADLKEVSAGRLSELFTPDGQFAGFVKHPRDKVWIAAVEGFAMAGGCEIALACDMIVASETSTFALPEVMRGLIAAAGGMYRLARALPRAIAMEMLATGECLPATRAAEFGLVNRLTPHGGAVTGALELAVQIASNAPVAVHESLQVARRAYDLDDNALFALGLDAQDRVMATEDFVEGPLAFIEKRAPRWKGR